jgi:hypothetical protein
VASERSSCGNTFQGDHTSKEAGREANWGSGGNRRKSNEVRAPPLPKKPWRVRAHRHCATVRGFKFGEASLGYLGDDTSREGRLR